MTGPAPRRLLVGLDDHATAGVGAAAATHVARAEDTTVPLMLHVLDTHTIDRSMPRPL